MTTSSGASCVSRLLFAAMGAAFCGQQAFADEVSIRDLSGARIDSNWFRYINLRFGLAVDIPLSSGFQEAVGPPFGRLLEQVPRVAVLLEPGRRHERDSQLMV
jgi:hypothetical protein